MTPECLNFFSDRFYLASEKFRGHNGFVIILMNVTYRTLQSISEVHTFLPSWRWRTLLSPDSYIYLIKSIKVKIGKFSKMPYGLIITKLVLL